MSGNPSGSGLERGSHCAAAFALNKANSTTGASMGGTANHDKIEGGLSVGGDLSHLPEVVQDAMRGALSVDVEVAFAIDVEKETVRLIGRRLGRAYGPLGPSEIPLTVDAVIVKAGGPWRVWDWKSRERVTPAKSNLQIRAGAIAVMLHEQLSTIEGAIGYLDNGEKDVATFDAFDAAKLFDDLRNMLNRIGAARALVATGGVPEVHSGPWCKYCPAMPYCPAHTRLAMSMLGELDLIRQEIAFFTPEQVSKAWDLAKKIGAMLETVDASLRLRISQSVIPRPNGKRLAVVDCSRKSFDQQKAKEALVAAGHDLPSFMKDTKYTQVKEVNHTPEGVAMDRE